MKTNIIIFTIGAAIGYFLFKSATLPLIAGFFAGLVTGASLVILNKD